MFGTKYQHQFGQNMCILSKNRRKKREENKINSSIMRSHLFSLQLLPYAPNHTPIRCGMFLLFYFLEIFIRFFFMWVCVGWKYILSPPPIQAAHENTSQFHFILFYSYLLLLISLGCWCCCFCCYAEAADICNKIGFSCVKFIHTQ